MDNGTDPRTVLLYSGGLDSRLACEVLRRAGVDVVLLQHESVFFPLREGSEAPPGVSVVVRDLTEEVIRLVAEPHYGLGKNANPCLDCKQRMYALAWEEAGRQGADFIATGEVLGQRPMSQNREAFARMEKGAGLRGLVLRPLSGRLLPPTIPEERGLIDRADLLDLQGRGRKRQIALAAAWGIRDYPTPAGGCKLTDPQYAGRVLRLRALGRLTAENLRAARFGRFVELPDGAPALIGRSHADNEALLADAPEGSFIVELAGRPGPLACVLGPAGAADLEQAGALVIRYSRFAGVPGCEVLARTRDEARAGHARTAAGDGRPGRREPAG
ncbi:MAG: tRNA 4-thiouridine(8) synthase ThiI [Candidatus Brocadiaceae bacterium]|nr:tRNA 4-thiouridine(8) synthase ThiI [Candidatus Brocadiaceae bacterium]